MPHKVLSVITVLLLTCFRAFSQNLPEEFFKGMENMSSNKQLAKQQMLVTINKVPEFHGSYHFLGVLYSQSQNIDSAAYCYNKSISLNKDNVNHTKEMTYVRLMDLYAYQLDFKNAFKIGWDAYISYPGNKAIIMGLKDICLWSYYIKNMGLDKAYLSPDVKEEYVVTSIPEEYLIIRKLLINDEKVQVKGQSLVTIKNASYDVLKYSTRTDKTEKELKFKLDWDMAKDFGGKSGPAGEVSANSANPVYERAGALLVRNPEIDLKVETEKLMK